jgi:predicted dehydrogenase
MIHVAVIGCGYWGPKLIRNFVVCPDTELLWVCDKNEKRLEKVMGPYPGVDRTVDLGDLLADERVDAVAVATPVNTHFPLVKACLENGKHVLVEKPLASSIEQGEEIVRFAREKGLKIMCDHTFCYTGAVRKMKEIVESGALGELLYFDSVRINLGLFQQDINVIWDLAPHDLSILDFLLDEKPVSVSADGRSYIGNDLESIAYVSLKYPSSFIAHFHVNWLSPVKIRRMIIGGCEKMLVWDDLERAEKIKIYNKGITVGHGDLEERNNMLVSYRSGDIFAPWIDHTEALSLLVREFAACIEEDRAPLTDGEAGLRVLRILEAAERSIKTDGANVRITYPDEG